MTSFSSHKSEAKPRMSIHDKDIVQMCYVTCFHPKGLDQSMFILWTKLVSSYVHLVKLKFGSLNYIYACIDSINYLRYHSDTVYIIFEVHGFM